MIIQLNPSKSEAYDQVISYHNLKIKTTEYKNDQNPITLLWYDCIHD